MQRMASARDETHARKATMLFCVAHYALRPWPWILVGLAALLIYPTTGATLDDREMLYKIY